MARDTAARLVQHWVQQPKRWPSRPVRRVADGQGSWRGAWHEPHGAEEAGFRGLVVFPGLALRNGDVGARPFREEALRFADQAVMPGPRDFDDDLVVAVAQRGRA